MPAPRPRHLVYGLVDPRTNELRYVGKSSTGLTRPKRHRCPDARSRKTHLGRWLNALFVDGGTLPSILIIETCADETSALAAEIRLIAMFRGAGFRLTNLTDGGEGSCGHTPSAETRRKMSKAQKGRTRSPETRARISEGIRLAMTPEVRRRMSEGCKRAMTPERRQQISEAKRLAMTPELKQRISEGRKRIMTPELKQRISEAHQRRWAKIRAARGND